MSVNKNMDRMLFAGPDLEEVGGVSFYCKAVLESYPGEVEYFPFPLNMSRRPLLFLRVLWIFFVWILKTRGNIQLNTSLNARALTRDFFFCILALATGRKPVVFIHGWDNDFQDSLTGVKRLVFRSVFNRAGLIIVLSRKFKDVLAGWGFTCPIEVETTCFSNELGPPAQSWSSSLKNPRILFLSRIVKEKGVFELVDACAGLTDKFPGLCLDIAGEGPDLDELKNYVKMKDYVFVALHGNVTGEDKNRLFSNASAFCLPTYYGEGLPIALIEAMYFGLPVITTGAGGISEVFTDRENGLSVKPGDVKDLSEKIAVVLSDHSFSKQISERNVRYAKEKFSPEVVAKRLAILHQRAQKN